MTTSQSAAAPPPWDIQAARALYNIQRWGARYFDINEAGHVVGRAVRHVQLVLRPIAPILNPSSGRIPTVSVRTFAIGRPMPTSISEVLNTYRLSTGVIEFGDSDPKVDEEFGDYKPCISAL